MASQSPSREHSVTAYLLSLCLLFAGFLSISSAGPIPTTVSPAVPSWVSWPDKALAITATEISVEQYMACVEAGACSAENHKGCNAVDPTRSQHPMNCVNYYGAEQYCAFVGGRICTETEWLEACRGSDGRSFPYGDAFSLESCNSQSLTVSVEGREMQTAVVGSHPACEGGFTGLFDMAGNVSEWVAKCKGEYCKFRGGGYMSNDPIDMFAGCRGVCAGNQKPFMSGTVGVRCCRDTG
ncbi:MAG: formylglycine-generating enzyme family protein [Candidatus Binatia bacterium]